jgi:hypothetical protein
MPKQGEAVKVALEVTMPGMLIPARHKIEVELRYGTYSKVRGISVLGDLPREMTWDGIPVPLMGHGVDLLGAVLDWLRQVDCSMDYIPAYRAEEDRQEQELLKKQGLGKDDVPFE